MNRPPIKHTEKLIHESKTLRICGSGLHTSMPLCSSGKPALDGIGKNRVNRRVAGSIQNATATPKSASRTPSSLPKRLTHYQKSTRLFPGPEGYLAQFRWASPCLQIRANRVGKRRDCNNSRPAKTHALRNGSATESQIPIRRCPELRITRGGAT